MVDNLNESWSIRLSSVNS